VKKKCSFKKRDEGGEDEVEEGEFTTQLNRLPCRKLSRIERINAGSSFQGKREGFRGGGILTRAVTCRVGSVQNGEHRGKKKEACLYS